MYVNIDPVKCILGPGIPKARPKGSTPCWLPDSRDRVGSANQKLMLSHLVFLPPALICYAIFQFMINLTPRSFRWF